MFSLPKLSSAKIDFSDKKSKRILLISEGFESRSLSWIKTTENNKIFDDVIIFKHLPKRESLLDELYTNAASRSNQDPTIVCFDRAEPVESEFRLLDIIKKKSESTTEIIIDISVMSKLLIIQLIVSLKKFNGDVIFVYTQPKNYSPSETEYLDSKSHNVSMMVKYPTSGVLSVIQTPLLSSFSMQQYPSAIIAFTSFNEQLVRALISSISASAIYFINGVPPLLKWRERATQEIHSRLISEYKSNNPIDKDGNLERKSSTLLYEETFNILYDIYKNNYTNSRVIISPTGSKMQALACGLFKTCSPDVHIEYPMPESFFTKGFSSDEIEAIYKIEFKSYSNFISKLKNELEVALCNP